MRRLLAPVALLLLAAGAVFLFWDAPAPETTPADADATRATVVPEPGRLDGAPAAPPTIVETLDRVTTTPVNAVAEASFGTPLPAGEGMLVRVLHEESREPIAAAEVLVADIGPADMPRVQQLLIETRDIEAVLEAFSVVYRTDAEGCVRVPTMSGEGALAARKGSLFGVARERVRGLEEVEILCAASVMVAALVVDEAGHAVEGVPVALRIKRGDDHYSPLALRSDAQGMARFRRLELFLKDDGVDGAALALDGPIGASVTADFDPVALPQEPLRLVLPPYGSVEIELRDARGEVWKESALLSVEEFVESERKRNVEFMRGSTLSLNEGKASYRPVGLGLQLEVVAVRPDGTRIGSVVAPGPLRAGGITKILVSESLEYSHLIGKLVNESREPIANAQIFCEIELLQDGNRHGGGSGLRTDASGGFRLEVDEPALAAGETRTLRIREQGEDGVTGRSAEIALSYSLPAGETDLGEIVLAHAPLLVSGTVVDEAGEPRPGASVQVQRMNRYGEGTEDWYWDHVEQGHVESGTRGEFAVHGEADAEELRVQAFDAGSWCEGTLTQTGAHGVRVVLLKAAEFKGSVVFDAGTDPSEFRLQLRTGGNGRESSWHSAEVEANGDFSFQGVRPGLCELNLTRETVNESLVRVEDLTLLAGENRDPRCDPLDARGRTRSLRISALDAQGKELKRFVVWKLRETENATQHFTHNGRVELSVADGPLDLIIEADGMLRATLERVSTDQVVRMRLGPRVRITVANLGEIPTGYAVSVGLRPASDRERGLHAFAPVPVDAAGAVEWVASATGTQEVFVTLITTGEFTRGAGLQHVLGRIGRSAGVQHDLSRIGRSAGVQHDLSRIEIGASGGDFTLRITPESLERALQQLRGED